MILQKNKKKPGYKKTTAGWIPENWEITPLSCVASIERGKFSARPRNDPKYYGGRYPFLQTGDVSNSEGIVFPFGQTLNENGLAVSRFFPAGTLLITIAANIADVAEVPFAFACPDSLVAIQPNELADRLWLKHLLASKKAYFVSRATQNAQANINLEIIRPTSIPLPPLAEQKAIAEVLDCWDKAIRGYEKKIEKKRKIKKGLMQRLLSGKQRLKGFDSSWKVMRCGDIAELTAGGTPSTAHPEF